MENAVVIGGLECIKHGTGLMMYVGQPTSRRTDAALFEEVLWQATTDEAENELAEQTAGKIAAVKDEGNLWLSIVDEWYLKRMKLLSTFFNDMVIH